MSEQEMEDLAHKAATKYVEEWVKDQKYGFINHRTYEMNIDYYRGFKDGLKANSPQRTQREDK